MSTHARGPWEVLDDGRHLTISPAWGGFTICRLPDLWSAETTAANARLIAAAPELLAALEQMLEAWDGYELRAALDSDIGDKAEAAIAAAKGYGGSK